MRRSLFYSSLGLGAVLCIAGSVGESCAQAPQLAPEGRGLLPKPGQMPATLQGRPVPHPFEPDPAGGFSRTVFETDEDPNLKIIIRDFSFPPDHRTHTVVLRSAAVVHSFPGSAEVRVARNRLALAAGARTVVPAGAPIEVTNSGELAVVVRAIIVEPK
jgi:hypothetical protein